MKRSVASGPESMTILKPSTTCPTIDPNTAVETIAPHFELVVLEQASCGEVLTLALDGAAANSGPFSS